MSMNMSVKCKTCGKDMSHIGGTVYKCDQCNTFREE